MDNYAVPVLLHGYVEVEAESREEANTKASHGQHLRFLSPMSASVTDSIDSEFVYSPSANRKTCLLSEWAEKQFPPECPASNCNIEFKGLNYTLSEAYSVLPKRQLDAAVATYNERCEAELIPMSFWIENMCVFFVPKPQDK